MYSSELYVTALHSHFSLRNKILKQYFFALLFAIHGCSRVLDFIFHSLGFGASACAIDFNMLHEHSKFRAVVLHNSMKSFQRNKTESKNFREKRSLVVSKFWMSLDNLQIFIAINFWSKTMNAYINGILVKESEDETHGGSTFTGLSCTMKPALWVKGGGIDVIPLTGLPFPGIPGITFDRVDILSWKIDCREERMCRKKTLKERMKMKG